LNVGQGLTGSGSRGLSKAPSRFRRPRTGDARNDYPLNPASAEVDTEHHQAEGCDQPNATEEDDRLERLLAGFLKRTNGSNGGNRKFGHGNASPWLEMLSAGKVVAGESFWAVARRRILAAVVTDSLKLGVDAWLGCARRLLNTVKPRDF
jgi:hypothetical protein